MDGLLRFAMTVVRDARPSIGRGVYQSLAIFIKVNFHLKLTREAARLDHSAKRSCVQLRRNFLKPAGIQCLALLPPLLLPRSLPSRSRPQPPPAAIRATRRRSRAAQPQYQQQVAPAQYRTVQETVMVVARSRRCPSHARAVPHRDGAADGDGGSRRRRLRTRSAPQYATQERVEMVAPPRAYYVPVAPRCSTCGY